MYARALTALCFSFALVGCSDEPVFEYDSRPIELQRAPPPLAGKPRGHPGQGEGGLRYPLLLVDTGSLLSSLRRGVCPSATAEPASYEGTSNC